MEKIAQTFVDSFKHISQYLNTDFLAGIYWETSYNNGDDNQYVCPDTQVMAFCIRSFFQSKVTL